MWSLREDPGYFMQTMSRRRDYYRMKLTMIVRRAPSSVPGVEVSVPFWRGIYGNEYHPGIPHAFC